MIPQVIETSSSVTNVSASSPIPNTLINTLIADLEKAISNLPSSYPDPTVIEESNFIPHFLPITVDHDDLWIFLVEPYLNRFLGFGKSVESVVASLKGQKKELVLMVRYLRDITGWFRIDRAPIERKVQHLIKALNWCEFSF